MSTSRWERLAPANGILFVALAFAGIVFAGDTPGFDTESDQRLVAWFDDSGNRTKLWVGAILLGLSIVPFLWYLGSLRSRLSWVEGGDGRLSSIAFAGGVVFASLVLVAVGFWLAPVMAIDWGESFRLDSDTARLISVLSVLPILAGALGAGVMVFAASILALRTGIFPRWLGWPGVVLGPALVLSLLLWGVPIGVFAIWVLATSAVMLRGTTRQRAEGAVPAPA
jgi:hypothetical protein